MSQIEVDTLIHARWVVPVVPEKVFHENYSVAIKDGKIHALLPTSEAKVQFTSKDVQHLNKDHALIPGLVNLHSHAAMSLLRGFADDVQLMEWLLHYMWPAEGKWISSEFVRVGSLLSVAEMIQSGVTCVNDMYFFPNVTAEVLDKVGMRGSVGAIMIQFPSAWASSVEEYFEKGLEVLKNWTDHPRVHVLFAPHATYTVDDAALIKIRDLSVKYDSRVHIHLHETAKEVSDHVAVHGKTPIQRLVDLGLFNERLIAVHMTQLTEEDIQLLSASKVNVAHCPESNLKLGSGICPVSRLLKAGVNVCLGTDGPASNDDLDMLGEIRTSALVDKYRVEDPPLPAWQMLNLGTINGAKALGLEHKIGSIEVGKQADIVAIKLTAKPVYNPINTIVYVGTNKVEFVWVDGKLLLNGGQLTTINVDELDREAEEWCTKISSWDKERKSPDIVKMRESVSKFSHLNSNSSKEELEEAKKVLTSFKDGMFSWTFFANRENDETMLKQLNDLMTDLSTKSNQIQEYLK